MRTTIVEHVRRIAAEEHADSIAATIGGTAYTSEVHLRKHTHMGSAYCGALSVSRWSIAFASRDYKTTTVLVGSDFIGWLEFVHSLIKPRIQQTEKAATTGGKPMCVE